VNDVCPLTPVEIEALRMLAAGLTHQEIAERERTGSTAISNRIARAGRKLGTVTPVQTVVVALCRGYLKNPARR
jgi:DNA-binding NarL/FixJ family response regulator